MNRIPHLPFRLIFCMVFMAACSAPLMKVTDKKGVARPFTNVLVVYVSGNFDFNFLDSVTYNIAIKGYLGDTAAYAVRNEVETILSGELNSYHTHILKSSDLFSAGNNGYDDFISETIRQSVEAVLIVDLGKYIHKAYISNTIYGYNRSLTTPPSVFRKESVLDAGFQCYLVDLKSKLPVWIAQVEVKGQKITPDRNYLKISVAKSLADSLVRGGYTAAH